MQAAERLFGTRRVHEITLDEIAREADVGKGTLYLYFADKEDMIFQAAVSGFEDMCRKVREGPVPGAAFRDTLLRTCETVAGFFQARRALFRIILSEGARGMEGGGGLRQRWLDHRGLMTEAVAAIIAQGMASGEVRGDVPAGVLAEYLLGMLRTRSWELEGCPDEQRSIAVTVDLFLGGAGAAARACAAHPGRA